MNQPIGQEERDELRATVRDFLAAKSDEQQVRRMMESERGYDDALWRQMVDQLGLPGLALPSEYGGDGFGFAELAVVLEEMGRALLPAPFLPTVIYAGTALAAASNAAAAKYLPDIAAGKTKATLAVSETDGVWPTELPATTATTASRTATGWMVSGEKCFVLDGATADLILVLAGADDGQRLFAVSGDAAGLTRTSLRVLDPTRRLARLSFTDVTAVPVGSPESTQHVMQRVLNVAMAALAAEQAGGARACLEASTTYARERMQFGRPIGSFQAVKHKCADMLVRVQLAEAAAREAADAVDGATDAPELGVAAADAHAVCSEAYMFVAAENIQVHGGIGFTWEHPAHLYFRRAKSSQLMFGGPGVYYERLLAQVGV